MQLLSIYISPLSFTDLCYDFYIVIVPIHNLILLIFLKQNISCAVKQAHNSPEHKSITETQITVERDSVCKVCLIGKFSTSMRCETTAQQYNSCFGIPLVLNNFTDFSFKITPLLHIMFLISNLF